MGGTRSARPCSVVCGQTNRSTCPQPWWTVLTSKQSGGGENTGPDPVDRTKSGSEHYVITDTEGFPLAVKLTGGNRHDVTQLIPLVDSVPSIAGKVGRPARRPVVLLADRAADC